MLDLLCVFLDHLRREFAGLNYCAKFGWSWLCCFEDMQVLILCEFGLNMLIHAPFGEFFGGKMEK